MQRLTACGLHEFVSVEWSGYEMVLQCHVQLAACPTTAAPVADLKEFIEHLPACGLHHTTERKLLASSVQAACPDCMTARFVRMYGSVCLYAPKVNMLHSQICTTEVLMCPGPSLYVLTKLWDGVQARLTRGVYRLGKLGCSSAVPSLKQPSCKACNRFVGCATLYRLTTHNHAQMACILHVAVVGVPRHAFTCLYMANGMAAFQQL